MAIEIVDLSIKNVISHSYVNVYQRVIHICPNGLGKTSSWGASPEAIAMSPGDVHRVRKREIQHGAEV